MSYNFKNLADVELLSSMPETANVLVEVDGATKRAPQVDEIAQIVVSEALEEVPEGATVLGVVNGEIKRIPSAGLGGGKTLVLKSDDFDNALAGVSTVLAAASPVITYTANMTFDEVVEAFASCELLGGYVFGVENDLPLRFEVVYTSYTAVNYVEPCVMFMAYTNNSDIAIYWTASGGISTEAPETNSESQ